MRRGIGIVVIAGVVWMMSGVAVAAEQQKRPATRPASKELVEIPIKLPKPALTCTPRSFPPGMKVPPWRLRPPFKAPAGTVNLAFKKPVISSDPEPIIGTVQQVTDGDKDGVEGSWVELLPGLQWVQIDLERPCWLYAVLVWHNHSRLTVTKDVIVQVSNDPHFVGEVTTIFNNDQDNSAGLGAGSDEEFLETYQGWLMPVRDIKARYVRLYSKGNIDCDCIQYTEVEVYGIPAAE